MDPARRSRPPVLRGLVLALQAVWGVSAWALPQGAQVTQGQVGITQPSAGTLQVQASNGAIINWQKFSIGAGEVTRFVQPDASSAVLNRVVGGEASQLLGQLQANGRVFLINPLGIVIGQGARIDTNSFIASTLDMADADFLAGRLRFMAGAQAAGIQQGGYITAGPGGSVALIAPDISNTGIIQAPDGNILLAAGRRLEIASTHLDGVTFEIQAPTDSVLNLGQLLADNGAVRAFAATLRQSGVVRAERLVQDADGSIVLAGRDSVTLTAGSETVASGASGGSVRIQSREGTARVDGQVLATGAAGAGGDIQVLGQRVALDAHAWLDASGVGGGGQIRVGGDFQGANAAVQNARQVDVEAGAHLRADALGAGQGGRVIVWADEDTRFAGALSARGGAAGGNGGFAEVSGKQNLSFTGDADLSAPQGAMGELLLDPLDIVISSTSGILPTVVDEFADFSDNIATVAPSKLASLAANVTLQAERNVFIKDKITLTTAGADLSITAGGASFNAGSIYLEDLGVTRPGGITTTGGDVTMRAASVSGPGTLTTQGGAVDILTSGALTYTSAIASGGGAVTLASQSSGVSSAQVNAGAGTINVTGSYVSSGSYTTTGTANLTATAGGVSVYDVNAAVANLNATSSVNAYVNVTDRVNAASSGSYVSIDNNAAGALRLGTLSSPSGLYLYSSTGMAQASGGGLASPYVNLYTYGSLTPAGTLAAPLLIGGASPTTVSAYNLAAPVHLNFGTSTVAGLTLDGTVAAVGGSKVTGSSNITSLALGTASGALTVAVSATGGFSNNLSLAVSDGGITGGTINLAGGGGLSLEAAGPVTLGNVTTTRASGNGFQVYAQKCSYYAYVGCADSSPISVTGFLNAGTGGVRLETYDNGNITVAGTLTAGDVYLRAGQQYYTASYPYYPTQVTTNQITLGTVVASGQFRAYHYGEGNIQVASLAAAGGVDVYAGNTYDVDGSLYLGVPAQPTLNQIALHLVEPSPLSGSFYVRNEGIGDIAITGGINRTGYVDLATSAGNVSTAAITSTGGSVSVVADGGNVVSGNVAAYYDIDVSGTGSVTTGNLVASTDAVAVDAGSTLTVANVTAGSGSTYGDVALTSGGDLRFAKIASSGYSSTYYGHVTLTSAAGSVETTANDAANDITATGNVTLSAGTHIGNGSFASPLDIQAGTASAVSLSASGDIGAVGKAVRVNTQGTLAVTTDSGQFHVAASDGTNELELATIRLSASAAGIGNGNTATLRSLHLDIDAASDGTDITVGDPNSAGQLVQTTGTLDEFRFTATGGAGLKFADVSFTSGGYNQFAVTADNGLTQTGGNINAGYVGLDAGSGNLWVGNVTSAVADGNRIDINGANIHAGNLSAEALSVSGQNLDLGTVSTSGTHRGYPNWIYVPRTGTYSYLLDDLALTASGDLTTAGPVTSATSATLSAGGNLVVQSGAGAVTAGITSNGYYQDTASVHAGTGAGNALLTAAVSGYRVDVQGHDVNTGNLTAVGQASISGTNLTTGAISGASVVLAGTAFATGDITATGALSVTAAAGYAPVGVDISAGSASITAAGDITIDAANPLQAASVSLTTTNDGNIEAALSNTTSLVVNTDRGFLIDVEGSLLSSLTVSAASAKALAVGSVGAQVRADDDVGVQLLKLDDTTAPPVQLLVSSTGTVGSWNVNYSDTTTAAIAGGLTIDTSYSASAQLNFQLASATAVTALASLNGGQYTLNTGGNVLLSDVQTGGAHVNVTSRSGDITVDDLSTLAGTGGNVTLTATTGNIESVGVGISVAGTTSGNVTLSAAQGSVGALGTVDLASVNQLSITAKDTVAVAVSGGLGGLSLTTAASGSGTLSVANAANFSGLSIVRNAGDLELGALTSTNDLSLTTTDGDLRVVGNVSTGSLALAAQTGNVEIASSGGPRTVTATGTVSLSAGQDLLVSAGAGATESVAVSGSQLQLSAGRDLLLTAAGASASLNASAGSGTQVVSAGRHLVIQGGSGTNAYASLTGDTPSQSLSVGGNLSVLAGTGTGAYAKLAQTYGSGGYSQSASIGGHLTVQGGNAASGQGTGAYAELSGGTQSFTSIGGAVLVAGGTASGNSALLQSAFGQSLGTYVNVPTDAISVLGGSGTNAFARIQALSGSQSLYAGLVPSSGTTGDITVRGGSGQGATAEVLASGSQTLGNQSTASGCCSYTYYATQNVYIDGGSGDGAFASVKSTGGSQTVYGGATIRVQGGSGVGAYGELLTSGGSQTLGSSYNYLNDATDAIDVLAGSGGVARVQASGSQTLQSAGALRVLGGSGANMTASVESTAGSQSIGYTYIYSNDPAGDVTVQGGTGSGAAAWIRAATGQTLDTGGTLAITGGASGAYAEVSTSAGTQTIGNVNLYYYDQTDAIALTGGAAGAYAKLGSGGQQATYSAGDITLTGGTGSGAGAMFLSTTGQQLTAYGNLLVTGGDNTGTGLNASGIRNQTSGNQSLNVTGNLTQTGGTGVSDTWIYQSGTGSQTLTVGGNLVLVSPNASSSVNSIEAFGTSQTLTVGGSVSVNNPANWLTYIASHNGAQSLTADSLSVSLAGSVTGAFAGVSTGTGHDQSIVLTGDGSTAGTATLSLSNMNATTGSRASVSSGGSLTLRVSDDNYDTAGAVTVGTGAGLGKTDITATNDLDLVAGSLTLQGGANAAATAEVNAAGTMNVSTLYGAVQLLAGSAGAATIDPTLLSMVSNGSVLMQAGAGSTANTNINAGTFNLAATTGDLVLNNSAAATSTITASVFNYAGPGAVTLNGGTITVSTSGSVNVTGACTNCSTNLVGPFSVTAYTPPPVNYSALVAGDVITLTDASGSLFELVLGEDGSVTISRRRVNQCF